MRIEKGVADLTHPGIGLELGGDPLRRATLRIDAQTERLEPLDKHPCIERAEARAGVADELLQVIVVELLRTQHGTAQGPSLTVDVFGGGVDDDVGTEFERMLQDRGGEDVVDHDEGSSRMGQLTDGAKVDDLQPWVRGGLEKNRLGPAGERRLPLGKITAVDKAGLDAEPRKDLGRDHCARAEQCPGGDERVAGTQEACQCGEDRRHAAGGRTTDVGAFDQAKPFFEHGNGGVAVTAVDVAVDVARERGFGLGSRAIDEARRGVDRLGGLVETRAAEPTPDQFGGLGGVFEVHRQPCRHGRPACFQPVVRWPSASRSPSKPSETL